MKRLLHIILGCVLAACSLAHAADDKSRKIMLDTTAQGGGVTAALKDFPLLVRLHTGNFTFAQAKPDGADLHFFAADGKTPLKHFIERWDTTNELGMVWVQVPALAPNAKTDSIVMHWGGDPRAADASAVYDEGHVLVLNFPDREHLNDATREANHGKASDARLLPSGPIGGATQFDGGQGIVVPASASLKFAAPQGWTFSSWINPTDARAGSVLSIGGTLTVDLGDGFAVVRQGTVVLAKSTLPLKLGSWQHLAVRAGGGRIAFFVDGAPAGDVQVEVPAAEGVVVIGARYLGGLDAVTLSRGPRSDAWIKASAMSQVAEGGLVVFADEGTGEEGINYFAILIGAVTIDGWVVIAILGVMALVSVQVMISKTVNLGRAEKANNAFLALFRERSQDMLVPNHPVCAELEANKRIRHSSIYQLYRIGVDELAKRVPAGGVDAQGLQATVSGASLEAIRASLDAAIVRAGQRFNKGIVLLTIAISGGPFLGLLGTVVGVMITFAAIAAAGDVNVNSIAPGIAAALVATVAGLAVAIPALFAYNWFAIRIKNVAADTQVFADEFLTRAAEIYTR